MMINIKKYIKMIGLIAIFTLLLSCRTASLNPIKWFYDAGGEAAGLDPDTPIKAMTMMEAIKNYKIWQYFGMISAAGGLLLFIGSFLKNQLNFIQGNKDRMVGLILIGFGFLFSWWGGYAPVNQDKIALLLLIGAILAAVGGIGYPIYKAIKHKANK